MGLSYMTWLDDFSGVTQNVSFHISFFSQEFQQEKRLHMSGIWELGVMALVKL